MPAFFISPVDLKSLPAYRSFWAMMWPVSSRYAAICTTLPLASSPMEYPNFLHISSSIFLFTNGLNTPVGSKSCAFFVFISLAFGESFGSVLPPQLKHVPYPRSLTLYPSLEPQLIGQGMCVSSHSDIVNPICRVCRTVQRTRR